MTKQIIEDLCGKLQKRTEGIANAGLFLQKVGRSQQQI